MDGRKQAALERLALLEPRELSVEAKTETCRAALDLRSCGRAVHDVLLTCGHACLCVKCSQLIHSCPICRTPPASFGKNKLRLYEGCADAGLLRKDADVPSDSSDVGRLCSFFDVALENNLVSLICHYVAEVCMDEEAVSSNAMVSILLDGGIVKDWCKRTFRSVTLHLRDIYCLSPLQMLKEADAIDWNGRKLKGVISVLESLETPLLDQPLSATLLELRQLLESVRKVLQHLEVMAWCARHQFLETVRSSYASPSQWHIAVNGRKSAAQSRARSETSYKNGKIGISQAATLFIEEALANLGLLGSKDEDEFGLGDLPEVSFLRQGSPASLRFSRDLEPMQFWSCYPPESVRAAVDLLFLEGTCDLILAKKAIFLYFLFDRHWASLDENWRELVDDYVSTFNIPRHFMLESRVFFLLDESSDHALEEACQLVPEICMHNTHPKVVTVLYERQKAEAALAVLRASGRDGQAAELVPLTDALAAVRVWLQCGLLTEGYLYQRAYVNGVKREGGDWLSSMEVLVGDICRLSMKTGLLDKMLVLPWRNEEELYVKKCLLDRAVQDPSSAAGNLLAVFYVQRYRYMEAHAVHERLNELEIIWGERCTDEAKFTRVCIASKQRARIVEKCLQLLLDVQQQRPCSLIECYVESPQPATLALEAHRYHRLESPLFGLAGGNLRRESMTSETTNFPFTSASASYGQPSFAHERLGLRCHAPYALLLNMNFPNIDGPTPVLELVALEESPVRRRRLWCEAEQPREPSRCPTADFGDVQTGDRSDSARSGSLATGADKRMPLKMKGTNHFGNVSLSPLESGLRAGGLHADDNDNTEMGLDGTSKWLYNTMLDLLGRSWLQRSVVKDVFKERTSNDEIGLLSVTAIFPWEFSKGRGLVCGPTTKLEQQECRD